MTNFRYKYVTCREWLTRDTYIDQKEQSTCFKDIDNYLHMVMNSTRNITHDPSLTHWGRITHICVSKLTIIGSDNDLSPGRRQAIIWTIAGIMLIGPLGTNFSETLIKIQIFSFKKMHLKLSSGTWRSFCLSLIEAAQSACIESCKCYWWKYGAMVQFVSQIRITRFIYIISIDFVTQL